MLGVADTGSAGFALMHQEEAQQPTTGSHGSAYLQDKIALVPFWLSVVAPDAYMLKERQFAIVSCQKQHLAPMTKQELSR